MNDYDPTTALSSYYTSRATRQPARHWAIDKLVHELAAIGLLDVFEGEASDPSTLTGYGSGKVWLRTGAGLQDEAADVLVWSGSGSATSAANWVPLTWTGFRALVGSVTNAVPYVIDTIAELQSLTLVDGEVHWLADGDRAGEFEGKTASQVSLCRVATDTVTAANIDTNAETFTLTGHGLVTGNVVQVTTSNYGLTAGNLYVVSRVSLDVFKLAYDADLATARNNAIAGTTISITAGSGNLTFEHLRDPLQAIVVIPAGLNRNGTQGGWVRQGPLSRVLPSWFGATTTATDCSLEVESAIGFARASWSGTGYNTVADLEGKRYRVKDVNVTNLRNPGFEVLNNRCTVYGSGSNGFDHSGGNTETFADWDVWGDQTEPPDYVMFKAKIAGTTAGNIFPDAKGTTFDRVRANGYAARAMRLRFSSEDWADSGGVRILNKHRSLAAVCDALVSSQQAIVNQWGSATVSKFCEIPDVGDGGQSTVVHSTDRWSLARTADVNVVVTYSHSSPCVASMTSATLSATGLANGDWVFVASANNATVQPFILGRAFQVANINVGGGTFELAGSDTSAATGTPATGTLANKTGPCLLLSGCSMAQGGVKGYLLSYTDEAPVKIDMSTGQSLRDLVIKAHVEHQSGHVVDFVRPTSGVSVIQGINIEVGVNDIRTALFRIAGSGTGTLRMDGPIVNVVAGNPPSSAMFAQPTLVEIRGAQFRAPSSGFFNALSSFTLGFTGEMFDYTTNTRTLVGAVDRYQLMSGAYTLDSGTFTPVLSSAGGALTGVTYSTQSGRYTRFKDAVMFDIRLVLTSKGTGGSGATRIEGLPFTSSRSSFAPCLVTLANTTAGFTELKALVNASDTVIDLYQVGDTTALAVLSWAVLDNASEIRVSGHYYTG